MKPVKIGIIGTGGIARPRRAAKCGLADNDQVDWALRAVRRRKV